MNEETCSQWFKRHQEGSLMRTEVSDLSQGQDWKFLGTHVGRHDNRFYRGVLVRAYEPDGSGNHLWKERFLLQSTSVHKTHGIVVLVRSGDTYLVQAKAEPGNVTQGCVVLSATIQASYESISRGNIPFMNILHDPELRLSVFGSVVSQDAGMLYHKVNLIGGGILLKQTNTGLVASGQLSMGDG